MDIFFHSEDIDIEDIDQDKIKSWIIKVLERERKQHGDINYIFCSDKYLLKINQKYLNHNYLTDTITFSYSDTIVSGDIYISLDRVQENAFTYKVSEMNEILRICVHGLLHLIGYNDNEQKEKEIMTQKENYYISLFYKL